ncbi:MAG: polysaccharide deacetylase family protein [Gammaproteobacteria bacterium]|nr:polysaccharide deacetylase family protein [Gammaproteobacteria bacterium]MBU3990038.1 polysaccharide deacetylase family protein [Gammaproteobacteria bacterium]MBU4006158.1 polysaccharide deacetylase family protein [Gammaproteobacteria bacterium]MBU4022613.1 polysaccharide deacetylase family protein [Gammaproteobacteria bacterium]MBU4097113.1 polysaccharide deacetylase family protein [Gammaproteobacteria bacterium]
MQFLAKHFAVLPLLEAVGQVRRGSLPRRTCCITFDDGYADNLTVALPILEKHRLPATVFVTTGYLDGKKMFNDAVIDAVAAADGPSLDLRELGEGELPLMTLADRQAAIARILRKLRYQPPQERAAAVAKLLAITGGGSQHGDIMLTSDQVGELSRRGVEIGGHTVTHNILTNLDDDQARQEIVSGKQHLEALTGKAVRVFAYPNGQPHRDYAQHHVTMVRDVGFELAVTTANGVCNFSSDIFQLPRFIPWGSSITAMAARMMRNAWV